MYIVTLPQMASSLAALVVFSFAFWRGGGAERFAAALLLANWLATPLLQHVADRHHFQAGVFLIDAVAAAGLLATALLCNRFWPLWATAFQLLELLMHLAMLIDKNIGGRSYFVGMEIASYLILASLAAGTWLEIPRRQNGGARLVQA